MQRLVHVPNRFVSAVSQTLRFIADFDAQLKIA
jgi:hypothetical protein